MSGEIKIPDNAPRPDPDKPVTITVGDVILFVHRKLWYTLINEASPVGFDMTLSDD